MNLLKTVKTTAKVAVGWTKHHAPQLLMAGGVLAGGAALYTTGRAAVKTQDILVDHKVDLNHAKTIEDKKLVRKTYAATSLRVAKEFAPAAGFAALSTTCFFAAYGILQKRYTVLSAAYVALDNSFKLYRQRVIEDKGVEADQYYLTGIKPKTVTTKDPETGEKVKSQVTDFGNGVVIANPYAFKFGKRRDDGELNPYWQKNLTLDRSFLLGQIDYFNDQLYLRSIKDNEGRIIKRGAVMLNEFRDACGQTQTTTASVVGNRFGNGEPGCNGFISEDCLIEGTEIDPDTGEEIPCIYVNPNVDGMIYDLLDKFEDEPFYPNYDITHGEDEWSE